MCIYRFYQTNIKSTPAITILAKIHQFDLEGQGNRKVKTVLVLSEGSSSNSRNRAEIGPYYLAQIGLLHIHVVKYDRLSS